MSREHSIAPAPLLHPDVAIHLCEAFTADKSSMYNSKKKTYEQVCDEAVFITHLS